jgi:glycosyltransferase involved in cell wall biosynthesis
MPVSNSLDNQAKTFGIFIPAYQAQTTLARVVRRIPDALLEKSRAVLVRDDASSDGTWEIAQRLVAGNPKLIALRNDSNLGFGGNNKAGYRWMRAVGVDAYAVLHGDLQYDPELLDQILEPILAGTTDVVLGSRMSGHPLRGGMPIERWLCNKALTWLMNRRLGLRLTDYHTGLVAFSCPAIDELEVDGLSDGHEFTAEILIRAATRGLRIRELPVPTHYPPDSRSCSRWTGVRYAWHVVRSLAAVETPGRRVGS